MDKELQAHPRVGPPASPFVAWRWDAGMGGAGGRARRHIHPRTPCPAGFPSGFSAACTPKIRCTLQNGEKECSACSHASPAGVAAGAAFCSRPGVLHRVQGFVSGAGVCAGSGVLHRVRGFAPHVGFCIGCRVLHPAWGFAQAAGFCTACGVLHRVQGFLHHVWGIAQAAGYCTRRRVLHEARGFARAAGFCAARGVLHQSQGFAHVCAHTRLRPEARAAADRRGCAGGCTHTRRQAHACTDAFVRTDARAPRCIAHTRTRTGADTHVRVRAHRKTRRCVQAHAHVRTTHRGSQRRACTSAHACTGTHTHT